MSQQAAQAFRGAVDDARNERDVLKRELLDVRASLKEARRDLAKGRGAVAVAARHVDLDAERVAARGPQRGVRGVPYFVVSGREDARPIGFSGAVDAPQLVEIFGEVL